MYAAQQQVIVALRAIDEPDQAARLDRCTAARQLAVHLLIYWMCLVSSATDPQQSDDLGDHSDRVHGRGDLGGGERRDQPP